MSDRENMAPYSNRQDNGNKENSSSPTNRRAFVADDARAAPQRTDLREKCPPTVKRPSSSSGVSILTGITGQPQQQKQHKLKSRFTVIRKLGKGTYGKVQLAINKETGQEVAIKTIKKTKIENDQDLQRVKREIQIMSSIEHPHIIHIYEVFENKDKIVLIMQYAPGGELYEYVSQSKVLDDSEARRLFRQIATAIYYCHQNKICHRDLKLENILLDEKNNAKLADFGLSNVFDKRQMLKTFCGSPLYASPEIVQGSPYEGPEVDCWSLGVLLYTLVYGAMPFDGSNFKRLVKQISEACYYEPPQKSLASPLIGRLLCADPLKRANILDICSDPWVNGIMVPRSPRLSPTNQNFNETTNQPQQSHASLMKVAQDMASLTPVRLDILLALAPTASELPPPTAVIPSIHTTDSNLNSGSDTTRKEEKPAHHPVRIPSLDPTLMEVDENRATSPVASYIVRNLDGFRTVDDPQDNNLDDGVKEKAEDKSGEDVVAMDQQHVSSDVVKTENESGSKEEIKQELEQTAIITQSEPESQTVEEDSRKLEEQGFHSGQAPIDAVDESQQKMDVVEPGIEMDSVSKEATSSMSIVQSEEPNQVDEVVMDTEVKDESPAVTTRVTTEYPKQPEQPADIELEKLDETENKVSQGQQQKEQDANIEQLDDNQNKSPAREEEKPKKKKKIVVVKRKKKVLKRDVDAAKEEGEAMSGQSGDKDKQKQDNDADRISTCTKSGTGKTKTPDTFQAAAADTPQQPSRTQVTGRRQSALIAEVSQKLLQLQQPSNTSSSAIEEDQQQLAGVRVSDKKEEFERRTSLANEVATAPEPSKSANKITTQANIAQQTSSYEPKPIESRQESLSAIGAIEHTIVEPVAEVQQPQSVGAATLIPRKESYSESITPTGGANEPQSKVVERLNECASRLSATVGGGEERSPNLSPTVDIRDDRSDSVDTIRAEISADSPLFEQEQEQTPPTRPNVRSSFQINLSNNQSSSSAAQIPPAHASYQGTSTRNKSPMLNSSTIGPAPIARSYKKVTFTKDGTCVTETGKIYSTQGDDGTVRRIERKSKVTHYPSDEGAFGAGNQAATAREEIHEEVTYENRGQPLGDSSSKLWPGQSQSSFRQRSASSMCSSSQATPNIRPFERLIMPSTEMFPTSNISGDHFESDGNDNGTRYQEKRQAAQQQFGRADSASSCSSGSTDVFDDTFDTWTGAISMFNQGHRLSDLHNSLLNRVFVGSPLGQSIFSDSQQRGQKHSGGGSLAGTPLRCESVEPPYAWGHRRNRGRNQQSQREHRGHNQSTNSEHSGYESDVPTNRPASATLGSARGSTFGSTNLFPRTSQLRDPLFEDPFRDILTGESNHQQAEDSFFGRNIFHDIELEHQKLRSRIAKQHKQLWKGSTPSLFQESARQRDTSQDHIPTASSISSTTNQSQTRLRQSVPLSSGPQRRNTANSSDGYLPPRQSVSKTSLVTSQLAQMNLTDAHVLNQSNSELQSAKTHRVASFIELKRSPSGTSSGQIRQRLGCADLQIEQQQHKQGKAAKLISQASDLSSAFWDGRVTPNTTSSIGCSRESQSNIQENPDSRVRSWLQQSSGNLSVSSGSRSSASETLASSSRSDPSSQMFTPILMQKSEHGGAVAGGQQFHHHLPPAPSRSPSRQKPTPRTQANQQHQVSYTKIIRSSSRQSIGDENNGRSHVAAKNEEHEQQTTIKTGDQFNQRQRVSKTSSSEFRIASQLNDPNGRISSRAINESAGSISDQHQDDDWHQIKSRHLSAQQQQQSIIEHQTRRSPVQQPASAPIRNIGDSLDWLQSSSGRDQSSFVNQQHQRTNLLGDNDLDESLSGSAADLESRSSSSLLDQLRSRGYRSMISQRMSSQQQPSASVHYEEQQQTSSQIVTATSSATSLSTTGASGARVITNAQLTLSTSAAGTGGPDGVTRTVQKTISSQHKTRLGQDNSEEVEDISPLENDLKPPSTIDADGRQSENANGHLDDAPMQTNRDEIPAKQSNGSAQQAETINEVQVNQETTGNAVEEGGIDDDDLDEDVREAKASIKEYLDRMRETEKFLKSLHEEEENQEKQRQQLFIFNNLLLNTKLNGIRLSTQSINYSDSSVSSIDNLKNPAQTARSAPICIDNSSVNYTNDSDLIEPTSRVNFSQSFDRSSLHKPVQNGLRNPTPTMMTDSNHLNGMSMPQSLGKQMAAPKSASCFSSDLYQPVNSYYSVQYRDPLEPVLPYHMTSIGSKNRTAAPSQFSSWHRSKSQLSDQFYGNDSINTSSSFTKSRRPLSATVDQSSIETNPYFKSRNRRSISQIRTSTTMAPSSSPLTSSSMMSEYRSSFGPNLTSTRSPIRRRATSPMVAINSLSTVGLTRKLSTEDIESSDESDAGMRDYRASSYVPKVVPDSAPIPRSSRHSRDYRRRSFYKPTLTATTAASISNLTNPDYGTLSPHRRTSLQTSSTSCARGKSTERSVSPVVRRRSLASEGGSSLSKGAQVEQTSSRLSELEQRIQANKRRREELLMGNYDNTKRSSPAREAASSSQSITRDSSTRTETRRTSSHQTRHVDKPHDDDEEELFERPPPRMKSNTRGASPTRQALADWSDDPGLTPLSTTSRLASSRTRSSRLESMEARIKRRSYCVRTSSPERPKISSKRSSAAVTGESSSTASKQLTDDDNK